jgi:succinyl-diaminopimelate desuccinylase
MANIKAGSCILVIPPNFGGLKTNCKHFWLKLSRPKPRQERLPLASLNFILPENLISIILNIMNKLEDLLAKLISLPTESHQPKKSEQLLDWVENRLKKYPFQIKRIFSNNFPVLLATARNTKNPKLWLAAHVDVVAGPKKLFQAVKKRGRLYGRGAFDMKFAVACYLLLADELKDKLSQYDFGIMLTADEELGGFHGVNTILEKGYTSKICFLPDGGRNWRFEEKAKGVVQLKISSKGKTGHASRPWLGVNAIEQLMDFLTVLKNEFPHEPCNNKKHFHNTLSVGKISGGKATNQIPGTASAAVDIRFVPGTDKQEIFKKFQKISKKFPDIKWKEVAFAKSYDIDRRDKYLNKFIKIAQEKYQIEPRFGISHGSSDARFFVERGISTIVVRPKGGGAHSNKEWIDLDDMERFYQVIKKFVEEVTLK